MNLTLMKARVVKIFRKGVIYLEPWGRPPMYKDLPSYLLAWSEIQPLEFISLDL